MSWRDDMANARAQRAHIIDMIQLDSEDTFCVECRARMLLTTVAFGAAVAVVALIAYRRGVQSGSRS